ncbi:MAG: tetratricopeptide repeat protein, partial [candidate division WOR-3 bacterium]
MTSNPAIKRYWLIVFIVTSLTCKKVIQPPQPQFEKLEAISSLYQKNPFQAIKLLHSIEDTNLQNEKARLLFKIYIDQRQYRHAINIVESLKIAVARESLAMVYARAGNFASAARFATHPLIKGIFFYRAGDYDSTIEQLKNPVNEYDDYRLHYLARALFKKGYWREVEQTLRTVKTIPPYLEEEHFELLARSLTNSGEPDQAEAIIEQIKDEPLRLYLKIGLLEQRGEKAEALNLAWGLITRFPRSNFALSMLEKVRPRNVAEFVAAAEVYYNINNYRKALNYLNHALKNPKANFLRGMIFYQLNNYDSALHYLTLCKNARSYYWRGRIYETRNQDSLAIIAYDSLLLKFPGDQIHLRALRRKGHLFEEKALFNKACSIWVAIANQFPQERRRHLFRCGLLCYRSGEVDKAREFFRQDSSPEFIYWQIRMNERLGLETESLRIELLKRYPMSYYTMIKERQNRF